jgi:hypothetical protein
MPARRPLQPVAAVRDQPGSDDGLGITRIEVLATVGTDDTRRDPPPGRPPRELLRALIDLQVRYPAAYMALQSGDASVLQEYSQRHDFAGKTEQIILAVAGRRPSATRVIRARMAVAAVKEGTMAVLMSGYGKLTDSTRLDVLEAAMAILDAGGQSSN